SSGSIDVTKNQHEVEEQEKMFLTNSTDWHKQNTTSASGHSGHIQNIRTHNATLKVHCGPFPIKHKNTWYGIDEEGVMEEVINIIKSTLGKHEKATLHIRRCTNTRADPNMLQKKEYAICSAIGG
ncbi:hypothetical protein Tco_0546952, partial [Tanacetum coccineum]